MASTTVHDRRHELSAELGGTLWLAAALFTATICLALSLLWLTESGPGGDSPEQLGVLAGAALASIVVASFADRSWSARVLRTTEMGNATRLFAITSVLFLIPTALISLAPVDAGDGTVEIAARDLDTACPAGVVVGSAEGRTTSCLDAWGVIGESTRHVATAGEVSRAEVAGLLDRLVRRAGEPLRLAPVGSVPADALDSEHRAAIGRVAAAGIMGGVGDDRFAPDAPVTRAQLSSLVAGVHAHVTAGDLSTDRTELFTDIDGSVHADAIRGVAVAGIAVGAGDTFSPNEPVTGAQLLTILARTLDLWAAEHAVPLPE